MRPNHLSRRQVLLQLLAAPFLADALHAQSSAGPLSATAIPHGQLLQPEELNRELQSGAPRPLILQVGSRILYDEDHIPAAEYAGPTASPDGLNKLRARVASLPHRQAIVIYCGCCPWDRCPNIGPAWRLLHQMGFTNVKALYIADNFGTDWVGRGYRAQKSE